jgi:hypothetical protein
MLETGYGCVPDAWNETLEMPITAEELKAVVLKGESNKSPGRDGIGLEFFKVLWEDIAGDMRTLLNHAQRPATIRASETRSHSQNPEKSEASYTRGL